MNTHPKISYHTALRAIGRPVDLARALNVTRASVNDWKNAGWIPKGRVWQLIALFPSKFPFKKQSQKGRAE